MAGCRVIGFGKSDFEARREWIGLWCDPVEEFLASDGHRVALHDSGTFDAVILHGDDIMRIKQWIRSARREIGSKLVMVVLTKSSPIVRAQLLLAGADDVVDTRMHSEEAAARMTNMTARISSSEQEPFGSSISSPRGDELLEKGVVITRPTPSQEVLLEALYAGRGKIVPYWILLKKLGKTCDSQNMRLLKVHICHLRSILGEGVEIRNSTNRGYELFVWAEA